MKFIPTHIPDVIIIEPRVFGDDRGYFMETWQAQKFAEAGINQPFVQDNQSHSLQGTLRGLHYQIKCPQGKLVRVLSGEVFDVAVDIRSSSPTFGQWVGEYLSGENKRMLWVPPGFAHGFYVTSDRADFFYKCTDFWAPQYERTLLWNDPTIGIEWPLREDTPINITEKDSRGASWAQAEFY